MRLKRREILQHALRFGSLALTGGLAGGLSLPLGCGREDARCYDSELLSTSELALRLSRGYIDLSDRRAGETCGGCQFFEAEGTEGCGHCAILGGPVNVRGRCDAWALRVSA